jgi:Flp pilus assembly protein TadD
VRIFGRISKLNQYSSEELSLRGYSQLVEENFEEALSCFERAIAIDPGDAYAWNGMGIAMSRLDREQRQSAAISGPLKSIPI